MSMIGKIALGISAAALLLYLLALALLFFFQRDILYPAPAAIPARPGAGFADIRIVTDDGLHLRAFYHPAKPGMPTLLFFHGNGSGLADSEQAMHAFAPRGYGVLLSEYRGYGGNTGSPTEQGLYRDGDAAFVWLAQHDIAPGRVVIIGNSLGSGVATEMAARHHPAALVLISGFASMAGVAQSHYPFVPAGLLLRDRYDNAAKLRSVSSPILLLHGTADTLVPASNAQALARAKPMATLVLVPGVGHELAFLDVSQARILEWLGSIGLKKT
jgi:fermentation-respiration switch protein FrsA (DUF1100 family)